MLNGLDTGDTAQLPDGTRVTKLSPGQFRTDRPNKPSTVETTMQAVRHVADGGKRRKLSEDELADRSVLAAPEPSMDTMSQLAQGKDTFDIFRGAEGEWLPEREELHERILGMLMRHAASSDQPRAVFLAGGPAAGKTTVRNSLGDEVPVDSVEINPDIVRRMLPEYSRLVDAGDEAASSKTHEESSYLSKLLTKRAMERGLNVVVDGVGGGETGKFAGKVQDALHAGYDVSIDYVTVGPDTAMRREQERAEKSGRHVNERVLRTGHKESTMRFHEVLGLSRVRIRVWDNEYGDNTTPAVLVASRDPGQRLQIYDKKMYRRFLAKGRGKIPKQ